MSALGTTWHDAAVRRLLTDAEIAPALASLPGWERAGGAIRRGFRFPTFRAAFAFMTEVAAAAEELDHHPDWSNAYTRVDVALTTHDAGGLTELDFALARRIAAAARTHAASATP